MVGGAEKQPKKHVCMYIHTQKKINKSQSQKTQQRWSPLYVGQLLLNMRLVFEWINPLSLCQRKLIFISQQVQVTIYLLTFVSVTRISFILSYDKI